MCVCWLWAPILFYHPCSRPPRRVILLTQFSFVVMKYEHPPTRPFRPSPVGTEPVEKLAINQVGRKGVFVAWIICTFSLNNLTDNFLIENTIKKVTFWRGLRKIWGGIVPSKPTYTQTWILTSFLTDVWLRFTCHFHNNLIKTSVEGLLQVGESTLF